MSARRATSETTAPGTKLSATIARFCSSLQRRRRSMPLITSTRAIAPSLAPVQTLSFALVLSPPASIPQGGPHRTGTILVRSRSEVAHRWTTRRRLSAHPRARSAILVTQLSLLLGVLATDIRLGPGRGNRSGSFRVPSRQRGPVNSGLAGAERRLCFPRVAQAAEPDLKLGR